MVRDGLIIQVPQHVGDISLKGVRRVDIQAYLTQQIGRFLRDPVVHALPYISILVGGSVGRPGYYYLPTDAILSDVVTQAGGPTTTADMSKTVIQRNGKVLLNKEQTNAGMSRRETLEDLQLMSGDQVLVGEKSDHGIQTFVQIGGILLGLAGVVLTLARH